MNDNDFPSTGRTLFTDEEYASAQEWTRRVISLEAEYKNQLIEAGDDADKKNAIIKLVYDEVGPVPAPVKLTMSAGLPIVVAITQYSKSLADSERKTEWTCPLCQSSNNGAFCMNCGSVKPAD